MAENTYKRKKISPQLPGWKAPLDWNPLSRADQATRYVPHILFLAFLGLLYIGNAHYGEKMIREITHLEAEVETLRADHTTLKAEFDQVVGKQSEIAEQAKEMGLIESRGKVKQIKRAVP